MSIYRVRALRFINQHKYIRSTPPASVNMTQIDGYHAFQDLTPTKQHILNCSYGSWYPKYAKATPKSHIISALPRSFVDYILGDGIPMPAEFYKDGTAGDESDYSDWETEEHAKDNLETNVVQRRINNDPTNAFKEVHNQIQNIIKENGPVLPKLNWSAPKDAAWILPNHSTKCHSASDIYLILNASSYIVHDLTESLNECSDIEKDKLVEEHKNLTFDLVLKEWVNINPAWEFRCFVKNRKIVAVSQRDPNYYPYLEGMSEDIKDKIFEFYEDNLKDTFSDDSFVFDLYLPENTAKTWLIDINPFARKTDSLLYSWNEVLTVDPDKDEGDFELRLVDRNSAARCGGVAHSENYVPKDMVDAVADAGAMVELMKAYHKNQLVDDSSDEDQ